MTVVADVRSAQLQPPLPRFAQIEPVGRCNLACRMCTVNERTDEVATLTLERFVALLDAMPQLTDLHLQGLGEPMLNPQFFDMVEAASARGIRVSANSNLTLLTERRAQRCVSCGLAELSISIDGASKETYEAIRRKASFAKLLRNVDRLVEARSASRSPLHLRAVMVLMRSNLHELPALVDLLHAHGIEELLVQRLASDLAQPDLRPGYIPIRSYVQANELGAADLAQALRMFEAGRRRASSLGVRLHLPRLPQSGDAPTAGRCTWPWEQLYFTAAGEMLPCCMVATADRASFGRVFDGEVPDVLAPWQGSAAGEFRERLSGETPPRVCVGCARYRGTF